MFIKTENKASKIQAYTQIRSISFFSFSRFLQFNPAGVDLDSVSFAQEEERQR